MLIDLHAGKEFGNRASLTEIRQAKNDNPHYQDIRKQECQNVIDELIAYRQGKGSYAHVTNKGVARDIMVTMDRIKTEVSYPVCYHPVLVSHQDYNAAPKSPFAYWS